VSRPMHLAFHDSLTGLKNRTTLYETLELHVKKNEDMDLKQPLAVFMIDLDNFKLVNDNYGHDQGDKLLKVVAQSLPFYARKHDSVFRRSGDEFVIIAP